MKLLKLGMLSALIILATIVALANVNHIDSNNFSNTKLILEDGLRIYKEEVCVDNFGNVTCKENTYVECNGNEYKIPAPTGFIVREKVYVLEYVEKECTNGISNGEEKPSPVDRIKDSDINVFGNRVVINIKNAGWRKFIDSNSMDPLIDEGTTTIEIKPKNANEIKVGDIIAYNVDGYDYAFVHRVMEIGNDENGVYFITKGDNYWQEDSKVRFPQVEGIVVGVLY